MVFLINASNLTAGGGIQVTQSICGQLKVFKEHHFIVVLSNYIKDTYIEFGDNIEVYKHTIRNTISTLLFGRDAFLDGLVGEKKVDAVLTVFGPSRWIPRVPHLSGFARAHLVLNESPYIKLASLKDKWIYKVWTWSFKRSSKIYFTENSYISDMLSNVLGNIKVYTVSNSYNQVFDNPQLWDRNQTLDRFDGITCLSVSTYYPHKNFEIIVEIVRYLKKVHVHFKVRFVLTFTSKEMSVPDDVQDAFIFIGKVDVTECPYLYEQCDIMFMPSLLECFTATYPEAMRMEKPIVTTDLEFAKGLCGDAACYYSAIDANAAAEAIYKVATNKEFAAQLVANGRKQLKKYDNYEKRAEKLIHILEDIS
jgi:glycosyltransferase involved in cell wall biosynthesis